MRLAWLLAMAAFAAVAQPDQNGQAAPDLWREALDVAFQSDRMQGAAQRLVIRFRPGVAPESQIELECCDARGARLVVMAARRSLAEIQHRFGDGNLDGVRGHMQVEQREERIAEGRFVALLQAFGASLRDSAVPILSRKLPGSAAYEIEFRDRSSRLVVALTDDEPGMAVSGTLPVVRWCNELRIGAGKLR